MKPDAQHVVAVFGSNDARDGDHDYQAARSVGRVLAELGYTVANGGYRGSMEASARGAKESGGKTIGVTCSVWPSQPNPFIDTVVGTDDLFQRVRTLIDLATDGYVVLSGATGTLVELALVWELQCKGFLPRRPIVCVGGFWRPLVEMMSREKAKVLEFIALVDSPAELGRYFRRLGPAGISSSATTRP